jgi:hypothetical protein
MTSTNPPTTTSARISARIEELESAVTTTGDKLLAAEQAHRSALRNAVESGDYAPTESTQTARDNALAENTRTCDALNTARDMLADALRVEAAAARAQAVEATEPLYATYADTAARCDIAFSELAAALRATLAAGSAVEKHIRANHLVPMSQPVVHDNRAVPRVFARVLEALATELGGGALHPTQLPDAPAANDAARTIAIARHEVSRELS